MMKDDDFKLLRGFADTLTDKQTFVIVESLSRLKMLIDEIDCLELFMNVSCILYTHAPTVYHTPSA